MNRTAVLFLFMSAVVPVLSMLRCSKCHESCNKTETGVNWWKMVFGDVGRSFITDKTMKRLLAPWEYKEDINITRLPETILTAKCQHDRCLNNMASPVRFNQALRVVPIKYKIRVYYRKLCQDRRHYKLVPGTFEVTVGCTCARA